MNIYEARFLVKTNKRPTISVIVSSVFCLSLITLTAFSIISLSNPVVSAVEATASTSANATVSVAEACTMWGDYDESHSATIPAGTNKSDIGQTTFRVICNDSEGFSVYAVGYSNYEIGNTKLLATIGGTLNPTYDIETGLAMDTATSSWAMKLTPVSGTYAPTILSDTNGSFASYHIVPATNTKVVTFNGTTDGGNNANGSAFTTTYRANIAGDQPAGDYNGIVQYTMVHPASSIPNEPKNCGTANRICYWPNANGVYEGTMGQQTASANTETALIASNFSKEGYGFAGWSDAYDYIPNEGSPSNPDARIYGPNETITTPSSMSNGLSLYAVWVKSEGSLQSWIGCDNLYQGGVTALTDQRDGQTYAVAKLADGNCWMIENLRLESTNSDNSTGGLAEGYGTSTTYGNFSGLATAESSGFTGTYTANSLYYSGTQEGTATIDIGTFYPVYRMPRYNNINTQSRATNPTSNSANNIYSYGNYYTWHAAIADLTYNGTSNQSTTGSSLCPAGWHLPMGGQAYPSTDTGTINVAGKPETFREFYNLGYKIMNEVKTAYEDTPNSGNSYYSTNTANSAGDTATKAFRKYPNNFLYSGYFSTASAVSRGSLGYYWSATACDVDSACDLHINSSNVFPGTSKYYKYYGLSIRCAADNFQ